MKVLKRQKLNTLLSAAIAATTGSMLASGYGMDSQVFFWILGGGILLTGFIQAVQDITAKQPLFGSSDVMIGVSKIAAGCVIALNRTFAAQYVVQILAGMAFFHGLYLLQQAVEVRRMQKMEAGIILAAAAFAAVAGVEILLAFSEIPLGIELCLFVDAGALLLSGILLFLVKPAPQQAKKPAAKPAQATAKKAVPAAAAKTAAPVCAVAQEPAQASAEKSASAQHMPAAETATMGDACAEPALAVASAGAAEESTAQPAACDAEASVQVAPAAAAAKPVAPAAAVSSVPAAEDTDDADEDSSYALQKLGGFASRASKRMRAMAKDTVHGFQEGMREGKQH